MIIDEHAKIVLVTTSGESYTIPESGIVKNTLSTSHSCSNSGGIPAGSCNAGTLSVSIRRPYGLQYRSLFGAKLRLYVWYGSHSEEQRGVYTLTSVTRSGNVLNISASDNIQLLDSSCYGAQDVQDAINGLLAILGNGNHTPAYIFNTICNAYSIPHLTQAENIEIIPEAGNKTGVMRLYGYSGFYGQFKPATNLSANQTYTLPNKSGTLAVASDLPVDSGWKSCTLGSFTESGTVKYRTFGKQITIYGESVRTCPHRNYVRIFG